MEPEFKSNADDIMKIRGVFEEFRQDIIRKDGYALQLKHLPSRYSMRSARMGSMLAARRAGMNPARAADPPSAMTAMHNVRGS